MTTRTSSGRPTASKAANQRSGEGKHLPSDKATSRLDANPSGMSSARKAHPERASKRARKSIGGEAFNDMCETFENRGTPGLYPAIPVGTFAASR